MANNASLTPKNEDNSIDGIYERVYVAILEHRLKPGTKLVEERLADIFAVSRPRIREVLARLAHAQIVELIPKRGAYVAKPSTDKALDVLEARRVIEPILVKRLIDNLTPEKLERLRQHTILESQARHREDKRAIIRLAGEFHVLLGELAGNQELARMVRELSTQTCLIIFLYNVPTATSCRNEEHDEIVEAIGKKDAAAAQRLTLEHLAHIEQSLKLDPEEEEVDLASVFSEQTI